MKPNDVIKEFSVTLQAGGFAKTHEMFDEENFGNWICDYRSNRYSLKFTLEKGEFFLEIQDNEYGKYHDLRMVYGLIKNDNSVCSIIFPPATYRRMLEEIIDEFSCVDDSSDRLKMWNKVDEFECSYRKTMF